MDSNFKSQYFSNSNPVIVIRLSEKIIIYKGII
jgi:hypothetical protein